MRILIIGNSKSAEILTDFFCRNPEHLVFTTKEWACGNYTGINSKDVEELKEFALANEINLTITADRFSADTDYFPTFSENNLAILCPEFDALKIASSKAFSKKFIYRNKIKTPKFAFFEKLNLALDYIRNAQYPLVIKPDEHFETETAYIAETFGAAKHRVETLFQNDNKKVLIEEYIQGKEYTFYALSDGFRPILIDAVQNFQNELSVKKPVTPELKEKIYNEIIFPVISALAADNTEYTGILGFDVIITPKNEVYLIECNSFFKDLDTEMILKDTGEDWAKLFMDTITGTLADDFETPFSFKNRGRYYGAFMLEDGQEIITQSAKTAGVLYEKLLEEGLSEDILNEARKLWEQ